MPRRCAICLRDKTTVISNPDGRTFYRARADGQTAWICLDCFHTRVSVFMPASERGKPGDDPQSDAERDEFVTRVRYGRWKCLRDTAPGLLEQYERSQSWERSSNSDRETW